MAPHSGHLSNSSSSELAVGSTRRQPAVSPTRRLRFEDETETEAESRYLERQWQRRWVGQRGTGVLVSKPDLNLYINSRAEAGLQGELHDIDRWQRRRTPSGRAGGVGVAGQWDSCGKILGGGINLNRCLQPPLSDDRGQSLYQPHLNLRTEPIKETYIGSITPDETRSPRGQGMAGCVSEMQVRRSTKQGELNGNRAVPTRDLPINPYAPDQLTTPISRCPSSLSSPSLPMSQSVRLKSTTAGQDVNQDREEHGRPTGTKHHRERRSGAEQKERSPCVDVGGGVDLRKTNSSSTERSSDKTGQNIYKYIHLHQV